MATRNAKPVEESAPVAESTVVANTTTDIAEFSFSDDALRSIDSFEAAASLAFEVYGKVEDASQVLGNGFALIRTEDGKKNLVGKPLMLLEWNFREGDFGGDGFVSIMAVAKEPNGSISKYIINDGSTGVAKMLRDYSIRNRGRKGGLLVRNGFRESTYDYCEVCGNASCELPDMHAKEHKRATTYYLDTSL